MKRPASLPAKAKWNPEFDLFTVGDTREVLPKHRAPVGEHRAWRADGTLFSIERFDKVGNHHGVSEWFHPDGTVAHRQEWRSTHSTNRGPTLLGEAWQRTKGCPAKVEVCECWMFPAARSIWRVEIVGDRHEYFTRDGSPCDKKGIPRATKAKLIRPKPVAKNASPLVKAWRGLEALLHERGLGSALHYADADLSWKESKLRFDPIALLPPDYRKFVAEVGYPMLGFKLYCDVAWSFLPPSAIRATSGDLAEANEMSAVAFFAGYRDLADVTGWVFAGEGKSIEVRAARDARVESKSLGTFTEWMTREIARVEKFVSKLSAKRAAELEAAAEEEDDPHRLVDYAIKKRKSAPSPARR